jgi:hypothetical protein
MLAFLGSAAAQKTHWVGSADLEVEFAVTDAHTGESIPQARVDIRSEGGFYDEREPRNFELLAGPDGRASYLCRNSMCSGTRGLFTDTFAIHLPSWWFRVVAEGYELREWTELDVPERAGQARRISSGKAKLVVPVTLHKL